MNRPRRRPTGEIINLADLGASLYDDDEPRQEPSPAPAAVKPEDEADHDKQ
jgi:hypothetical protein